MVPTETNTQPIEKLLKTALERFESGDRIQGWRLVKQALSLDPGIGPTYTASGNPIRANLQRILRETRLPSTFKWLAAVCRSTGDDQSSRLLLERYAELAPGAGAENRTAAETRAPLLKRAWSWLRSK